MTIFLVAKKERGGERERQPDRHRRGIIREADRER